MNPNVRALAERLADALAESEEYRALKEAREEIERHQAAVIMLRDFQSKQAAVQQKMLSGEAPSEEEIQRLEEAYRIVSINPYIRKLIEAEVAFSEMMMAVQRILAERVGLELPETGEDDVHLETSGKATLGGDPDDDGGGRPSRLWVPGR